MNELIRRLLFLPEEASRYSRHVDRLHFFVIATTMVVAALVFATTVFFVIKYRRRSESDVTPEVKPKAIHEILFIGTPLFFFLLWFAIGFPLFVDL